VTILASYGSQRADHVGWAICLRMIAILSVTPPSLERYPERARPKGFGARYIVICCRAEERIIGGFACG
jgi:hypothetical protein